MTNPKHKPTYQRVGNNRKYVLLLAVLAILLVGYKIFKKPDPLPPGQYRVLYPSLPKNAASSLTVSETCKKLCREGRFCADLDGTGMACHTSCNPDSSSSKCRKGAECGAVTNINDASREVLGGVCVTPP